MIQTGSTFLSPVQFERSSAFQKNTPTLPLSETKTTTNIETVQIQVQDILQLGDVLPETVSNDIGQLNEALQSLRQLTNSGPTISVLSILNRYKNETLPQNISALKSNQRELRQQIDSLPASSAERKNLELQSQITDMSLEMYRNAETLLANSPLLQNIPDTAEAAEPEDVDTAEGTETEGVDTAESTEQETKEAPDLSEQGSFDFGDIVDSVPSKQISDFVKGLTDTVLSDAEQLSERLEEVGGKIIETIKEKQAADQSAITELINLSADEVIPTNFERIDQLLTTYNQSIISPKPPLPKDLVTNLEVLFLNKASQQEPAEQTRLLNKLPGLDANDVTLLKARGSLGLLGQIKESQGDLTQLPDANKQSLTDQLNTTLKMSGASFRVEELDDNQLNQAVKELEKQFGLPETGEVSVENLREIEKTQKNLYVMITNARNILHDEILPEDENKVQSLESLVGKGEAINQKEALTHVNALRQKYFWLTDKQIPSDKLSPELYSDTMKARQNWLTENREVMKNSQLFLADEAQMLSNILKTQPGWDVPFSQLQAMADDMDNFTLKERAVLQKVVKNNNLYDYIATMTTGDSNKDGKLDHSPQVSDRQKTSLRPFHAEQFRKAIFHEKRIPLSTGDNVAGVRISEFRDGRAAAARLYDATKVSGDELLSWTGTGAGTNENVVKDVLKNAQESRGQLMGLRRDYMRMYGEDLPQLAESELEGGDLGESLTYIHSSGEDWIAEQEIGSVQRAEFLLAKFKPQIDAIGANNGAIEWAVGHSSDDRARQQELRGLYDKAQQSLNQWKANPQDPQTEKELMTLTSKVLIRLQADQQADTYYDQAKDEAVDATKKVAIVAAATVATVATGGAGAPALLAAVAYGTAAGTVVALGGEAIHQYVEYENDTKDNATQQRVAREQQQAIKEVSNEDEAFKTQMLDELDATQKGLQNDQAERKMFDTDKLWNATYEGFKTSLLTSGMTGLTMGLGALASTPKMQTAVAALGKSGNLTRMALINGVSGATGEMAGNLIAPLKLNTDSSPEKVAEVLAKLDQHVAENDQLLKDLETQKSSLQAQISAFNQKYQAQTNETEADTSMDLLKTVKQQAPSEAEVKALFTAQIQLEETEKSISDLTSSNQDVKKDIEKIKQNEGKLLTWDSAEWDAITENLGRNLAFSFASGAVLNLVGGKNVVSRMSSNVGSGVAETAGRNLLDGKDITDGLPESGLSALFVGESSNKVQNRITLKSTAEGQTYKQLKKDKTSESKKILELLDAEGFKGEDASTHAEAFTKVSEANPELQPLLEKRLLDTKHQQALNSTGEGRAFRNLQANKTPENQQILELLEAQGFRGEDPSTHTKAFAKVSETNPEIKQKLDSIVNQQYKSEFLKSVEPYVQSLKPLVQQIPKANLDVTLLKAMEASKTAMDINTAIQELKGEADTPQNKSQIESLTAELQKSEKTLKAILKGEVAFDERGKMLEKTPKPKPEDTPKPKDEPPPTIGSSLERVTRLEGLIKSRLAATEGGDVKKDVGFQKLEYLLNDKSLNLTDELKTDFLHQVETRLTDPANNKKSVHDIMKDVVADSAKNEDVSKRLTHLGNKLDKDVLEGKKISKVIGFESLYGRHLTTEAKLNLLYQHGISNARDFALAVQKNPKLFDQSMLDLNVPLGGQNDVGWWSITRDTDIKGNKKGKSDAQDMENLVDELALDKQFYVGGGIRITIPPERALGNITKPTPFDGVPFKEWVEAPVNAMVGLTANKVPEGVMSSVSLKEPFELEIYTWP